GAVLDLRAPSEGEGVHEIPGDRPGRRVGRVFQVLPGPRSRPEHEDPGPGASNPDGAVGGAGEREHVDPETGRVRERGKGLGTGGSWCRHEHQARKKCGVRSAECGMDRAAVETASQPGGSNFPLQFRTPHSALRIPHWFSLSACKSWASTGSP